MNMIQPGEEPDAFASFTFDGRPPSIDAWQQLASGEKIEQFGSDIFGLSGEVTRARVRVSVQDRIVGLIAIGQRQGATVEIEHVLVALRLLAALPVAINVDFLWTFSNVAVEPRDAPNLLRRWIATGEPPVLSIIRLNLEEEFESYLAHRTYGLRAFVGHELAISFRSESQSRHAAGSLAKVARHALMNGPIVAGTKFTGLDGIHLVASSMSQKKERVVMLNQVFQ